MKKFKGLHTIVWYVYNFSVKNKRVKRLIVPSLLITALLSTFPMATSYVISLMWNTIQMAASTKDVSSVALNMLIYTSIIIAPFIIRIVFGRVTSRIQQYFFQYVNFSYREKKSALDYAYYDDPKFHDMLKNADDKGVGSMFEIFNVQFRLVDMFVSLTLSSIAISFMGGFYIASMILSVSPIFVLELMKRKAAKKLNDKNRKDYRYAGAYSDEIGVAATRVFNLNKSYLKSNFAILEDIMKLNIRFNDKRVAFTILAYLLFSIGLGYNVYGIFKEAALGNILIGTAVFQISALWIFLGVLINFTDLFANIFEQVLYANDFAEVLELPKLVPEKENAKLISKDEPMEIVFENVSFKYPGREELALDNVSLQIKPGQKVSFVGENGGGKSTMIKLLLRFYDPTEGRILINGVDLKDINLESYRNMIGYVRQSPSVPNLVINDILSHEGLYSESDILSAAKRSRSNSFIEKYENGYNQRLGKRFEGGVNPSDGQSQRLAIARAYSKDSNVLIFDEPTADLDPETQNHFFDDYYNNNPGRTGILVAHFLQGVMEADSIFVFEKAKVSQSGTHSELVKSQDSWYKTSFLKQFENVLAV